MIEKKLKLDKTMLPERLKYMANKNRLTQKYIADKYGLSQSSVCGYMVGDTYPTSINYLACFATEFNTTIDFLIGLTNIPEATHGETGTVNFVGKIYERMSASDKKVFWALADKYISPYEKQMYIPSDREMESEDVKKII